MEFLPDFGIDAGNRRDHDETTAPEPQPAFQGESGACREPNQVWAMDLTYIPMARGFVYLCAVVDWFSRKRLADHARLEVPRHQSVDILRGPSVGHAN